MSEQTEVQENEGKVEKQEVAEEKRSWFMKFLDVGSRAGIILAAITFVSEYNSRHIERTERSFQLTVQKPPQSDVAAMALSYLNQEITYPLCPFKSFCNVRNRTSFENLELYNADKDEGIRLEKDNIQADALENAKFRSSDMRKISISEINLKRAEFREIRLQGAQLLDVDLTCSKFINSDMDGATVHYKSLSGAEFLGTNISNVTFLDEDGGPQAIDPSEDRGQRFKQLEKRGLLPHTLAGAWAWKGQEPVVPKAYQTYEVCEKPEDLSLLIKGKLGKPDNCERKVEVKSIPKNVCQQLEANGSIFDSTVKWVDRQVGSIAGN